MDMLARIGVNVEPSTDRLPVKKADAERTDQVKPQNPDRPDREASSDDKSSKKDFGEVMSNEQRADQPEQTEEAPAATVADNKAPPKERAATHPFSAAMSFQLEGEAAATAAAPVLPEGKEVANVAADIVSPEEIVIRPQTDVPLAATAQKKDQPALAAVPATDKKAEPKVEITGAKQNTTKATPDLITAQAPAKTVGAVPITVEATTSAAPVLDKPILDPDGEAPRAAIDRPTAKGEGIKPPTVTTSGAAAATPAVSAAVANAADGLLEQGMVKEISGDIFAQRQSLQTAGLPQISIVSAPTQAALAAANPAAQIVAAMRTERNGNAVEVRLDPPELGRVRMEFSMETADAIKGVLYAERSETLDHLRRNVNDLLAGLKAAGFSSIDLSFSGENIGDSEQAGKAGGDSDRDGVGAATVAGERGDEVVYLSLRENALLNMVV